MRRLSAFAVFPLAAFLAASPVGAQSLDDLSFLIGSWTSDRGGFVIEESWTDAKAGVVVGSSRGVQNGAVRFLRFAVVEETPQGVVMRFKRFNADYTTWEAGGPSVMRLIESGDGRALFEATDDASDVRRIRYRARPDGAVEVTADRIDADGPYLVEFTMMRAG